MHGEEVDDSSRSKMMGLLHFLNRRLSSTGYLALTDHLTLADLAIYVSIAVLRATRVGYSSSYQVIANFKSLIVSYLLLTVHSHTVYSPRR